MYVCMNERRMRERDRERQTERQRERQRQTERQREDVIDTFKDKHGVYRKAEQEELLQVIIQHKYKIMARVSVLETNISVDTRVCFN